MKARIRAVLFLQVSHEVAFIAVLKDEVEIIGCLFYVIKFDDVSVIAGLQYFDLVFKELHKFTFDNYPYTFDALSLNCLDRDILHIIFVIPLKHVPILTRSYLPFEHIVVHHFWHFEYL